jgi:probable phosphoglycerate mutase
LTRDQTKQRWPDETELWFGTPHLGVIPGGETLAAVLSRTTAALGEFLLHYPDGTVVLVGHDSVNRVLLLFALELPLSRYWHLRQDPCCVDELLFDSGSFIINSINQTQHLSGP